MAKYVCPVCDRPMKGMHYCAFCRQFVKNPHLLKSDYFLNERHGDFETNCDYHGNTVTRKPTVNTVQNRPVGSQPGVPRGPQYIPKAKREENTEVAKPGTKFIGVVITWMVLLIGFANYMVSCFMEL